MNGKLESVTINNGERNTQMEKITWEHGGGGAEVVSPYNYTLWTCGVIKN